MTCTKAKRKVRGWEVVHCCQNSRNKDRRWAARGRGPSQEGLGGQEGLRPLSGSWVSYEGSKPMNNRLWLSFEREH